MPKEGRFSKDKFGGNMPMDAPLYSMPPIHYKDVEALNITYETNPEAALDLLPEGLTLPEPAMAVLLIIRYPFSTLGPYEEVILGIACAFEGQPRFYIPHIVVNSDIPQAAGREIWGYPKKMAHITLEAEMDLVWGFMERPTGNRIVSAGMRLEQSMEIAQPVVESKGVALRVIPSPEKGAPPSIAQLIEVDSQSTTKEAYSGPGWIKFESDSMVDPWHKLEVKNIVSANYFIRDQILGHGKVVKTY